jgi:hypothetical protein
MRFHGPSIQHITAQNIVKQFQLKLNEGEQERLLMLIEQALVATQNQSSQRHRDTMEVRTSEAYHQGFDEGYELGSEGYYPHLMHNVTQSGPE